MAEKPKSTFENVNDLFRVLMWPLIVLIRFCTYKSDVNKIISLIPKKLESSSKISVWSLSFEIEKTAKISGYEGLGEIIKNLSEEGIRKLLTLGSGVHSVMIRSESSEFNKEKTYSVPSNIHILMELEKTDL